MNSTHEKPNATVKLNWRLVDGKRFVIVIVLINMLIKIRK